MLRGHSAYVPPEPLIRAMPKIEADSAPAISSPTEIRILARIDETGRVASARVLDEKNKSDSALVAVARAAAKDWTFRPATRGGKPIASEHVIVFDFHSGR